MVVDSILICSARPPREIRQEVSFLAVLDHPNLTKLCGVRTSPYMCLLLELAPQGALSSSLKEYRKCGEVLEPVTLHNSIKQVSIKVILL